MAKLGIFMANGCEEIEGLTVVDLLRRVGIEIDMISITTEKTVEGAHGIAFMADYTKNEADYESYDGIVLPGGMPGTLNLKADPVVQQTIRKYAEEGKLCAAICAAPSIFGEANLLNGKNATSYPGFEESLLGATIFNHPVVVDGNFITSRGMGTAIPFALEIIRYFKDDEAANELAEGIIYQA